MDHKPMPFLRDIDDEHLYAQRLENVFLLTYEFLAEVLAEFPIVRHDVVLPTESIVQEEMVVTYEKLARMRHQMSLQIRDMADRRRRLSDATRGLADVEFEKD